MKIKVHKFYVWPDVMGSRPGMELLEWAKMRVGQQQAEISEEEVVQWRLRQEHAKDEINYIPSIFSQ